MRILVLAAEPVGAKHLRDALPAEIDPREAEVMVVVPALQDSALHFWLSDADDAIARAEQVRRDSLERLGEAGIAASGDTGESDPADAIQDALKTFAADRILVFTRPDGEQRYREDLDEHELQRRFGIPVTQVRVGSGG